jgi:hypothetical protein
VFLRVREQASYDNRGGQDAKRRSLYWLNTTMRHPRGETSSSAFSTRMEIVIRRKNELRTEYANRRLCINRRLEYNSSLFRRRWERVSAQRKKMQILMSVKFSSKANAHKWVNFDFVQISPG